MLDALKYGNWGFSFTAAGFATGFSAIASANLIGIVSNANAISDMNGLSYSVSVSGGFLGDISGEFFWAPNVSVIGFSGGAGIGGGIGVHLWFSDTWAYALPGFVAAGLNDELQQPVNQIGWGRAKSQRILLAAEEEALPSGASLLPCYNSTGTEAM